MHSAVKPNNIASFDAFLGPRLPVRLKELGSWKSFGTERKRLKGIESEDMYEKWCNFLVGNRELVLILVLSFFRILMLFLITFLQVSAEFLANAAFFQVVVSGEIKGGFNPERSIKTTLSLTLYLVPWRMANCLLQQV